MGTAKNSIQTLNSGVQGRCVAHKGAATRVDGDHHCATHTTTGTQTTSAQGAGVWSTVVWSDSVNLPTYIVHVLAQHYGFSLDHARKLTKRIDAQGKAVVAQGLRERVEADVQALHSFGIRATMEPSGE